MHSVRNAVVAGLITLFLPMSGLTTQAISIALEIKKSLAEMTERAAFLRDHGRDFSATGVNIRSAPHTRAAVRDLGNPGDHVSVRRTVRGERVSCPDGVRDGRWFEITDQRTQVSGYVSGCFLSR